MNLLDESSTDRLILYVSVFVVFLYLVGITILYINSHMKVEELEKTVYAYQLKMMEANRTVQSLQNQIDKMNEQLRLVTDDKVSCEYNLSDCEYTRDVLRDAFLHNDRLMSIFFWYEDLNSCADLLENYNGVMDMLTESENFFMSKRKILESMLNDEVAKRFGYEHGIDVDSILEFIEEFKREMISAYNYCRR